ncbi:unnamed protein product [Mytilus coruscus]|uniref:Ig-like domain-containing protein n=1 Tax=Mytilus coruscus TaxID=42192 RepID=A0A6J8ELJ4_MYTCO|nr:unnamed protein product [Mytilus coruscus]
MDQGDFINSVWILATNITLNDFQNVASFDPDFGPKLQPFGKVLFGNASLSPFNKGSKRGSMSFDDLNCKHSRLYKCRLFVKKVDNPIIITESEAMGISVQVPPSKPDSVLLVHTPADSSVPTTKHMDYSSSSPSTAVTSNENETVSASQTEKQNITTAFNHSTIHTTGHNSTTSTPSHEDLSTNSSYRTTTYSIQQTTTEQGIAEGNNITVVCTGDVGNPPVEHVFQKYINGKIVPMKDTVTSTSIPDMPENCSYYRTSNLTFQLTAKDNNAVIRCVVNSSMVELDMYVETAPIKVYYEVRMPTIQLYPNKTDYVVGLYSSIDLICKSDGNPKPNYHWYKENHNMPISNSENFTITDMNKTDSGMYTCNVSNTFNGNTYNIATYVRVNIIYEADISTTQSSSTGSSSGADDKKKKSIENTILYCFLAVVGVVLITVITICVYKRRNTSEVHACEKKSKSLVGSSPKPVAESRTGDYDDICLEEDANKKPTINNVHKVEDIREHNKEYLRKQEEDEQKKNESNKPPQPVYAQVNEATKSRNKQNTETLANEYEEGTYAETQEGIYDKAGDRRHKKKTRMRSILIHLIIQGYNGDTKSSIQSSQIGSYDNQAFQKNEDRKVATVSPQVRSSGASQDDKQTSQTRDIQSKKGYENVKDTNQTGTSEEVTSHQTAL